jgi:hypothetical protein
MRQDLKLSKKLKHQCEISQKINNLESNKVIGC